MKSFFIHCSLALLCIATATAQNYSLAFNLPQNYAIDQIFEPTDLEKVYSHKEQLYYDAYITTKKAKQDQLLLSSKYPNLKFNLVAFKSELSPVWEDLIDQNKSEWNPFNKEYVNYYPDFVLFKPGSSAIEFVDKEKLLTLRDVLLQYAHLKLMIQGHTDNTGNAKTNLDLSIKRAKTVRDFLILNGVNTNRLRTKVFGEQMPVSKYDCGDKNEGCNRYNRRVDFILSATLDADFKNEHPVFFDESYWNN